MTCCIASFKERWIIFDPTMFCPEEMHITLVDGVNFITQQFHSNQSTNYSDHKSHSCGLKNKLATSVWQSCCVWVNGPYPAGKYHDKALFCGAESMEDPQDTKNREALLFQIPDGKKLLEINTKDKIALRKMAIKAVAVIVEYEMKYHPLFEVNLV
ncbi:hypothetical protein ACHAW6_012425 [Cyclotella cf. meneghiniana]